jgi:4-hydroxy-2-oxoglutarate aldolase
MFSASTSSSSLTGASTEVYEIFYDGPATKILTHRLCLVVIAGTNGEAATLRTKEKAELLRSCREVANSKGVQRLPLTVGCTGGCTRDVIDDTRAMHEADADFALVLVPSYFHFAMDSDAIVAFFQEVADASPLPLILYNFPGVVSGLDLNSEMLETLGAHPNIVAVKLTCGGIAKVARVAAVYSPKDFAAFAGQSDCEYQCALLMALTDTVTGLVPGLSAGGQGCITGLANLYPKTCVELYNLFVNGKNEAAEALQLDLAMAEWGFAKGGINGTKWVVAKYLSYPESSSACRRPYPAYGDKAKRSWIDARMSSLAHIEKRLSGAA